MRSIYMVGAESTGWTEVNLYSSCIIHEWRYDGGFFRADIMWRVFVWFTVLAWEDV